MIQIIFRHENVRQYDLTVVFVSHQKIHSLNKRYLGHNYATDVIAFDMTKENLSVTKKGSKVMDVQGDIYISADAAIKNAKAFRSTAAKELFLYIVHGILHLLGYDDHKREDIKKMRLKESELMNFIGNKVESIVNV